MLWLATKDPVDDVADFLGILGFQRIVGFFNTIDLDFGVGGDVFGDLVHSVGLALVFRGGFLEGRAVFFLVDGMAFQAAAFLARASAALASTSAACAAPSVSIVPAAISRIRVFR